MPPHVILSLATLADVNFIVDIKTNADLWVFESDISTDKEAMRKTVTERIGSHWYKQYIIELGDDAKTRIGELHIHWGDEERKSWEMGYCIFPQYQGHGYCTEAAKLALQYAFEEWGAHRVFAMCNAHNHASRRIMEKIGMTREAVFREELPWNGTWVDQYFYAILDREYKCAHSASSESALDKTPTAR